MSKTRRTCVFCGAEGTTKEHVLRRKFQSILGAEPFDVVNTNQRTTAFGTLAQGQRTYRSLPFDLQVKAACASCNNGWMNDLENAVEPQLTAMIRGDSCRISSSERLKIARWASKTTLMRQLATPSDQAQWSSPRFEEVYRGDLEGPVWIALAHVEETHPWPRLPISRYVHQFGLEEHPIVYSTICIGHLVIHSVMDMGQAKRRSQVATLGNLHVSTPYRQALRVALPGDGALVWPPPRSLPSSDFAANLTPRLMISAGFMNPHDVVFV